MPLLISLHPGQPKPGARTAAAHRALGGRCGPIVRVKQGRLPVAGRWGGMLLQLLSQWLVVGGACCCSY